MPACCWWVLVCFCRQGQWDTGGRQAACLLPIGEWVPCLPLLVAPAATLVCSLGTRAGCKPSPPQACRRYLHLHLSAAPPYVQSRAVECCPQHVELWMALARLETYENARKVRGWG